MREKIILYFGEKIKVGCDEKCHKAWGVASRPKLQAGLDDDDIILLADGELGLAPEDPGTYEGFEMCAKPTCDEEKLNKWCVRNCERCERSEPGELDKPLELPNWDERSYNMPWKHN